MSRKGLALTLAAVMVCAIALPVLGQGNPFRDVPLDHWAYDAIAELAEAGLVEGYPDGTFGGERTFTRYEMAMVFARILARFEALLQDEVASTVDERVAELQDAIDALAEQAGGLSASGVTPPITIESRETEDGTVEAAVRLSPEMEDAVRAVVVDQIRRELGELPPEVIAELAEDEEALGDLVDARAGLLGRYLSHLAEEFDAELQLLGVRVEELERVFGRVNERLAAVEQQVAEAQSAAETAVGIAEAAQAAADAADAAAAEALEQAEAVWQLVEMLGNLGASEGEVIEATALAGSAQEAADSAQDRAYRARLAAERVNALAQEALEAAERAARVADSAQGDAEEARAQAIEAMQEAARQGEEARAEAMRAMERAQRADQQAYRARLTAERALARLDELESHVADLQQQVDEQARRPVLGGELRTDYDVTHTSSGEVRLDPRDKDSDKISTKQEFSTSVGLTASFSPAEDVDVEGGLQLKANWFGSETEEFKATDLHLKVTTPGMVRMAYFGSLDPTELAKGFNKYVLDPETYKAKVEAANRGGALIDTQIGNLNARFIGSRFPTDSDKNRNFYGFNATLPLADGLNVAANYLWWTQEERTGSVQAFGETGGVNYDFIYALYKDNPAVDAKAKTNVGDLALGFEYRMVDGAFGPESPADPDDPQPEELPHLGKLLKEDDGDLLPDQRRWVADASLPVGIVTAVAEKGRHDKKLDASEFTDWVKYGFKDMELLGFNIGVLGYNDTREAGKATQAVRVDVSRTFELGLPLTLGVSYANANLNDNWSLSWKNQSHLGIGLAVKEYQLTDALTLDASIKTESHPIKDDKWTEPENWDTPFKDDNDDEHRTHHRDVAGATVKFRATDNFTVSAGYELERRDTTGDTVRDVDVRTTSLGAAYTLQLAETDVTLGYGYELQDVSGYTFSASPKTTYSVGLKRELLGASIDALYKVVVGRGKDDKGKVDAVDTIARLDVTYPLAESMDFTLSGKWGQSSGNSEPSDDYYYASVRAGLGVKF